MTTHSRGQNVKRVEVVWPEDLVAQIDGARGPLSRSAWLRRLAEERVAGKVADSIKAWETPSDLPMDATIIRNSSAVKSARQLLAERTAQMRGPK